MGSTIAPGGCDCTTRAVASVALRARPRRGRVSPASSTIFSTDSLGIQLAWSLLEKRVSLRGGLGARVTLFSKRAEAQCVGESVGNRVELRGDEGAAREEAAVLERIWPNGVLPGWKWLQVLPVGPAFFPITENVGPVLGVDFSSLATIKVDDRKRVVLTFACLIFRATGFGPEIGGTINDRKDGVFLFFLEFNRKHPVRRIDHRGFLSSWNL